MICVLSCNNKLIWQMRLFSHDSTLSRNYKLFNNEI